MITVQWHVVYMEYGVRNETDIMVTGKTYSEACCCYLERLSAFRKILISDFVDCKIEDSIPCASITESTY